MKKAIFTVLLGGYDRLNPAPQYEGWDAILFTDRKLPDHKGWTAVIVESEDPKRDSRKYKWLSHYFLPDYDMVCHIDANMVLRAEPRPQPIWFRHYKRTSVRQEMDRLIQVRKQDRETLDRQWDTYLASGFQDDIGLFENGFFIRMHTDEINRLHDTVWQIIKKYSHRDQIALPAAIFMTGIHPKNIVTGGNLRTKVNIVPHSQQSTESLPVNVHHITPARGDKNLGRAINELIEFLPDNDWICLRDIDTIPTQHVIFLKQCEDIARAGEFDLVGCMSNRIGLHTQLHNSKISEETDFMEHKRIGLELYEKHGSQVVKTQQTIAGQFMLFSKKVWSEVGKFPEGGIRIRNAFVDHWFSTRVKRKKKKLGVAIGMYIFHDYRLGQGNPKGKIQHLL